MSRGLESIQDDDEEVPQYEYCPICIEPLSYEVEDRTTVTLCCLHEFHLDCIGSTFNAKGKMQCPVCRNIGPGRWLYANGRTNPNLPPVEDRPGLNFRPFNLVSPTMPIGSLPASLSHHGLGPDMFPFGMPMSLMFGPSGPRQVGRTTTDEILWLSSFGRNHYGGWNGMATNSWVPNEYDGLSSVDALRRDLILENMELRNQVEHSLALIADNERDIYLLGSTYSEGESSRTGARRGGGSNNGGSDSRGGGGSGNCGGCMNCGRSG